MKRIIYFIAALVLATDMQAQVVDKKGIDAFIRDIKALKGEHVECEWESFDKYATEDSQVTSAHLNFLPHMINISVGDEDFSLDGIWKSDPNFSFVVATSDDDTGYQLICAVLDKYEVADREDFFGIPLMVNNREDGEQQVIFMDDNHTLVVSDDGEEAMVLYGTFNLLGVMQNTLVNVMELKEENEADVKLIGDVEFTVSADDKAALENPSLSMGASPEDILRFARGVADDNIAYLESHAENAANEAEREELAALAADFKAEQEENFEELANKLDELEHPKFIKIIPGTNEYFVAIPKVSPEVEATMKPYAKNGIYDWINNTGFSSGHKTGYTDQISCIITPYDVAREYAIRNFPRNRWYKEGYAPEYKEYAAKEFQGGTPAVLYRFSQNEEGYNDMLQHLGWLFGLEAGDRHWNLEVTQQSENNGKRFVQLWGEGGISVCLFDSPADKYCHFSVVVGGTDAFEKAVNEYAFGGERGFAEKCNIIIDSDLSNNSYGIHFTTDDYFHAGRTHRNGVHIDFGYARMFKGVE